MPAPRKVTHEGLLDAAAKVFAKRGYDGTSISDLLAELEITRPTLYMHTRGKRELLDAIHARLISRYKAELPRYVRAADPPLLRIRGFVELQLAVCADFRDSVVLVNARTIAERDHRRSLVAWWKKLDRMLLLAIRECQERNEMPATVEPRLIGHAIWATLNDLPYWFDPKGKLSPGDLADQFIHLLTGGRA